MLHVVGDPMKLLRPDDKIDMWKILQERFASIAERKLRRRQLTEDGNVEISGRDLR